VRYLPADIARTYGVNVIGDRYYNTARGGVPPAALPAGLVALFELPDQVFAFGQRWDFVGLGPDGQTGPWLIRMRSRSWPMDRPKEFPIRLLNRWRALIEQHGALPIEEYVMMATSLRDGQQDIVQSHATYGNLPPHAFDLNQFRAGRSALRLYGLLSPAQRQSLERGHTITPTQMTPGQRKLLLDIMQERSRTQTPPGGMPGGLAPGPGVPPAAAPMTGLSMVAAPMVLTVEHRGEAITMRIEPVAEQGADPQPPLPSPGQRPPLAGAPAAVPPDRVERHPVAQVQIRLQYGNQVEAISLIVARPG
jgi:hypothetical protein